MVNVLKKFLLFLILITSALIISCSKSDSSDKVITQDVKIYLVALEGTELSGKLIGCNDVLVPKEITVNAENSVLESTLNELIAFKSTSKLQNFVRGPALMLIQVTIANGIADVYLRGDFNISGSCDIARIKEQIYETLKQFTEYRKINLFINNQTFEKYLDVAGATF
ncbi:MAG: GerMN domain-containing protein [Bacteroidota bacterium]